MSCLAGVSNRIGVSNRTGVSNRIGVSNRVGEMRTLHRLAQAAWAPPAGPQHG